MVGGCRKLSGKKNQNYRTQSETLNNGLAHARNNDRRDESSKKTKTELWNVNNKGYKMHVILLNAQDKKK